MDSRTVLDYALFQLTPTRTRCDLVVFAGDKSEKLGSGLLEPFVSHLKSARDQICKGGYSIALRPATQDVSWFTRATLERFVRFVSTPEVLERFVTIEREIDQIEISLESNEQSNGKAEEQDDENPGVPSASSKLKVDATGSCDTELQENPKVRLQRVLESRRAILQKEQAMTYARALVAGFELDYMHDLVSFSDAFGALRLREACINFMELCKKKNGNKIWMDEIEAMKACSPSEFPHLGTSGIELATESNNLTKAPAIDSIPSHMNTNTDGGSALELGVQSMERTAQVPYLANHPPQFMQNFQGHMFQQVPQYPGFAFPGMHVAASHYPESMSWPSNFQDSSVYTDRTIKHGRGFKSSAKKEKRRDQLQSLHGAKHNKDGESVNSSSESEPCDDPEHEPSLPSRERMRNKKYSKRSSRKVVIRNINYITSSGKEEKSEDFEIGSSDGEEFVGADSLKNQVEEVVGSLKRHQKPSTRRIRAQAGSKKASHEVNNGLDDKNAGTTNSDGDVKDGNWDIFQNLLMKDAVSRSTDTDTKAREVEEDYYMVKLNVEENSAPSTSKLPTTGDSSDLFLLNQRSTASQIEPSNDNFEEREKVSMMIGKYEELLIPKRAEGENQSQNSHLGTESSIIKNPKDEDWFEVSQTDQGDRSVDKHMFCEDQAIYRDERLQMNKKNSDVLADDSFMVQSRPTHDSLDQQKMDAFLASDIVGDKHSDGCAPENRQSKAEISSYCEPNDLYMVLGRDSIAEKVEASWDPNMELVTEKTADPSTTKPGDSGDSATVHNDDRRNTKTGVASGRKADGKATKPKLASTSVRRITSDTTLRSKISTSGSRMNKSTSEQEEEKNKKLEELRIQRQKRIAARSATKAFTSENATKSLKENKKTANSTKIETPKRKDQDTKNKETHKPVLRSYTSDHLSTARAERKPLLTAAKSKIPKASVVRVAQSVKTSKGIGQATDNVKSSDKNTAINNLKDSSSTIEMKEQIDVVPSIPEEPIAAEVTEDYNNCIQVLSDKEPRSLESLSTSPQVNQFDADDYVVLETQTAVHPAVGDNLSSPALNIDEISDSEKSKPFIAPEVAVSDSATPPPPNAEIIHSRKKWNNGETSSKGPKGFRKLLLFGRKS